MRFNTLAFGMVTALCLRVGLPAIGGVPGDVDGDTLVTSNDSWLALMIAGGTFKALAPMVANGDVASATGNTPDGRISLVDAVRIIRAVNGLDTLGGSGTPAPSAALSDTVTLSVNTAKNYKLPKGFTVSGTAKDTGGLSITNQAGLPLVTGTVNFTSAANPAIAGTGQAAPNTGAYSTLLGAATYNVTIESSVVNFNVITGKLESYSIVQTASPSSVTVSADKTQNFVRPDLPASGTVAGTVTSTSTTVQAVTFTLDAGGSGQGQPTAGSYSIPAPPGTGHISMSGKYTLDSNVGFGEYQFGSPVTVTPGGSVTHNLTVPALGAIHGLITVPAGTTFSTTFAGNFPFSQSTGIDEYYSLYQNQAASPGSYHLALPPGTYPMSINLAYPSKPASTTTVNYLTQATFTAADVVQNITLPALGAPIVFSGMVQDSSGKALSGATVQLTPHNTGSLPNGYYATATATTDASGNFAMNILPSTYDVLVTPP